MINTVTAILGELFQLTFCLLFSALLCMLHTPSDLCSLDYDHNNTGVPISP